MYSEEIKYISYYSDENTYKNPIRNGYFENRSCLANVLDFLNQEVVIISSPYFSYPEGGKHIIEDCYIDEGFDDPFLSDKVSEVFQRFDPEDGFHIYALDDYITIVGLNNNCIFTNKHLEDGAIIGSIFWVKNFDELLEKFSNENLKRISKAIVHPHIRKAEGSYAPGKEECLDLNFFTSLEIYQPEVIFKYTIDSYMENVCIDVYNKLEKSSLSYLVDKYIQNYKGCNGYEPYYYDSVYSINLCKCGRLRVFCYLNRNK